MVEKSESGSQKVTPRDAQKGGQGALSKEHPEIALNEDGPQTGSVPPQSTEISNGLTKAQVELLCDIGERDLSKATGDEKRDLENLLSDGYVEPRKGISGSRFELTTKGTNFLGRRGAGLNEA